MAKMNNNLRALELTILSAEALSLAKTRPVKKNVFVIIKTDSSNDQITTMDAENGSHPSWNQKFFLEMSTYAKFFTLEVHCKNSSGDHVVGSARVPVSDFSSEYFPSNYLHFLSYRLKDKYGERNGIINLSVRIKSSSNIASSTIPTTCSSMTTGWNYGATVGQSVSHGVVIGVPIQNRYQM